LLDSVLSAKLTAAFEGIEQIPAEAADISFFEGLSLGRLTLKEVKEIGSEA
jgi:hypothetical protein